jgi:hypothetical protein
MPEVFVSYAHADDQPFAEGVPGWVTAFADRLKKSLGMRRGGSRVEVWMDHRLEPQRQVDTALHERVGRADCFVAILSPRYLESKWCRMEIEAFVNAAGGDSERVFLVELAPTQREEWPSGIARISTMQFWAQAFDDPAPIPLGWPVADPAADRPYWRALNELSHFIAGRFQASEAAPRDSAAPCVWIADPTDHVLESWERLAGALRQQGYRVLPAAPGAYRVGSEDEYKESLDADLAAAGALVQLFGPHPGRRPLWSDVSFTLLQSRAAQAAAASRNRPFSTWRSPDVHLEGIADQAYAELLTGAAAGGFEDFQRHVLSRMASKPSSQPAAARSPADDPSAGPLSICVSADGPDRALGQHVRDVLFKLGADASLTPEPAPNEPPAQWRQGYEALLGESHGVVIVYGSSPASWVQAQVQAARKLFARTRKGIWGALLDGPPGEQPDHGVRSHSLMLLDCRKGIGTEPLAEFLELLRSAGTGGGPAHA